MNINLIIGLFGLISGFLSGMFGIGGGVIVTPMLVLLFPLVYGQKLPIEVVTGLSSAQGFFSSALSFFHHKEIGLDLDLIKWFALPMAFSNFISSYVSVFVSEQYILLIFGLLGFFSLYLTFFIKSPIKFVLTYKKVCMPLIGATVGVLCGIVGQGGGFIYLPILVYIFGLNVKKAVPTSAAIGIIAAIGALLGRFNSLTIFAQFIPYLIVGIFVGSYFGSMVSKRMSQAKLKYAMNIFLFVCSLSFIYKALF
jgi:uncharacterized membrane protein YfcA